MEKQKEKVNTAVAIAYEPGEEAPKILATGKGLIAERIIEKAKEEDCLLYTSFGIVPFCLCVGVVNLMDQIFQVSLCRPFR